MQQSLPLLDRGSELSRLDRAWETACSKKPALSFISGGPGIGKTTLLNEWVKRVRPVIHIEVDFSGNLGATTSALIEAFWAVLKAFARDNVRWKDDLLANLGREGSGIREIFPGFHGNSWFQPVAMLLDGEQLNRRFLHLLKSLVLAWSRCYGAVLFTVENWHLADKPLQGLLLQLSQDHVPLLCIATSRQPPVGRWAENGWLFDTIELSPFSSVEVRRWIAELNPSEKSQIVDFYAELCDHAKGNPLYLQEILRSVSHAEASEIVRGSLDSWLDRKVRDLPYHLASFLEAGAVLGAAFRTTTALECAELGQELTTLAADAVRRGFVTESNGVCFWIHDLIRDAMLRSIGAARHAALSWNAALHIIRARGYTRERLLMFPTFFRAGRSDLSLSESESLLTKELFVASARLMRRMMNLSGARSTLDGLIEFMAERNLAVSDQIWIECAEVAFESGDTSACIAFLKRMSKNVASILWIRRELILCRCYYVERNFTEIFNQIGTFASVLWPSRLLKALGPAVIGRVFAALIPLLRYRLQRLSPVRLSRRRQLAEYLLIAVIFFTFQHDRTLSAAIGLSLTFALALRRPSFNLPMAGVIVGMFGNLPRWATGPSLALATLAGEKQRSVGNPSWNTRFEFLFNLFYAPHLQGVKETWASRKRPLTIYEGVPDPEVETVATMDLRQIYFWSNVSIAEVAHEFRARARTAEERGNVGLATVLRLLDRFFESHVAARGEPYELFLDPNEEKLLFQDLHRRKELFVESGLRFIQAFFALLVGNWTGAVEHVRKASELPRDTSYWIPRVFDGYTDCISRLLGGDPDSIAVPYSILKSTVKRNPREFRPYLTHVHAEIARRKGHRNEALLQYQAARAEFHALDRPVLEAFVDWRMGDLYWEGSEQEIARPFLERAMSEFSGCSMNASVSSIRAKYGWVKPDPESARRDDDYMTVALQLHRLTLLGKLASEIAHEIKNVNHSLRLSAEVLERDLAGKAADDLIPTLRVIQNSSGKIDKYLSQFRLTSKDSGGATITTIDLGDVIQNTITVMAPVIKRFTRRFRNAMEPGKLLISGQPEKIDQVVMNLVLNACESLSSMDQSIVLQAAADEEGQLHGFEVIDQGCGIPKEILDRVMEPFFTTKRERGGTGLGLALCKRIVDEHHGTMRISSEKGAGTTVKVLFPKISEHTSAASES